MPLTKEGFQQLLNQAAAEGLTLAELQVSCLAFGVGPDELLNTLALDVAQGYLAGTLSYGFCDGVMSGLIDAIVDVGVQGDLPQPAFALYQAFDDGEWVRRDDPPGTDPAQTYTRHAVLEILRGAITG